MSLYLKYRPHSFEHLVGQEHVKKTLQSALKEDRVAHAYLFCGPRGTGKTSSARLIAKALNCENRDSEGNPCDTCEMCTQINNGRLTDIIEIDAASNRGIDEIRDLREKINYSPNIAKYKVYIIDEVHMLTKEAFNALLKTLEEPPSHAYFILATTEIYKVPETIISRCQRFDFHRMSKATLVERLTYIAKEENVDYELEALECIADRVNGGMRDAIGILEQGIKNNKIDLERLNEILGLTENKSIADLFDALLKKDVKASLDLIQRIHNQGFDLSQLIKDFLEYARMQMLHSVNSGDKAQTQAIIAIIEEVEDAKRNIKNSSLPQLSLEVAAIKIGMRGDVIVSGGVTTPSTPVAQKKTEETVTEQKTVQKPVETKTPQVKQESRQQEEYKTTKADLESGTENDLLLKLRTNWKDIVSKIKNPAVRLSFKDARAVSISDGFLMLHFTTNFHLEKASHADAHRQLEDIIESIYKKKLGIKAELRKPDLEPTITDTREHKSNAAKSETPVITENTTIEESPEEAVNVFDSW